jgi:glucosamine-phosphate N-acetyltransferase
MKSSQNTYYILVVVDKESDELVATGSLILEHKFLRSAGTCGHIEDIAVSKKAQGKRLGYHIVTALTDLGEEVGCYKVILDCSEDNRGEPTIKACGLILKTECHHTGFYEKCGHEYKGIQMAKYKT